MFFGGKIKQFNFINYVPARAFPAVLFQTICIDMDVGHLIF